MGKRFDLLVSPTSPTVAFRLGERTQDPLAMYLSDIFTIPSDLSGTPAISCFSTSWSQRVIFLEP